MELVLNAGFASAYFITQPERAVAAVAAPAALLCYETLIQDHLAVALGRLAVASSKPLGSDRARQCLADIIQNGTPREPLVLASPLLIVARGVEKDALAPLLIMKMRGYAQILAISVGPDDPILATLRDQFATIGAPLKLNDMLTVFASLPMVTVVSGVTQSVVASGADYKALLQRHPNIAQDQPLAPEHYLFRQ